MGAFGGVSEEEVTMHNLAGAGDWKSPFKQLQPPSTYCTDSYQHPTLSFLVSVCFPVATLLLLKKNKSKLPYNMNKTLRQ